MDRKTNFWWWWSTKYLNFSWPRISHSLPPRNHLSWWSWNYVYFRDSKFLFIYKYWHSDRIDCCGPRGPKQQRPRGTQQSIRSGCCSSEMKRDSKLAWHDSIKMLQQNWSIDGAIVRKNSLKLTLDKKWDPPWQLNLLLSQDSFFFLFPKLNNRVICMWSFWIFSILLRVALKP